MGVKTKYHRLDQMITVYLKRHDYQPLSTGLCCRLSICMHTFIWTSPYLYIRQQVLCPGQQMLLPEGLHQRFPWQLIFTMGSRISNFFFGLSLSLSLFSGGNSFSQQFPFFFFNRSMQSPIDVVRSRNLIRFF